MTADERDAAIREAVADWRRAFTTDTATPALSVPTLVDLLAAEPAPAVAMHPDDFARLVRRLRGDP